MKNKKFIIAPMLALIMMLAYYSPWLLTSYRGGSYNESLVYLRIHAISVIFFSLGSIPTIILIISSIVLKIKKSNKWLSLTIISLSLLAFYIAIWIGMARGYIMGGILMLG
jgi:O-antigen/teichoic acid export membrane protein